MSTIFNDNIVCWRQSVTQRIKQQGRKRMTFSPGWMTSADAASQAIDQMFIPFRWQRTRPSSI